MVNMMQLLGAITMVDVSYPKSIQVHCTMVQPKNMGNHTAVRQSTLQVAV